MKHYKTLLLSVAITSNAHANINTNTASFKLLRGAAVRIANMPEFIANTAWKQGGVTTDELIEHLQTHEPHIYNLHREQAIRIRLVMALDEVLGDDFFSMLTRDADGSAVRRYLRGNEPDLTAIALEVINMPNIYNEMQWGSDGVEMAEILAAVKEHYRDVYDLYVNTSSHKTDLGLGNTLGKILVRQLPVSVFRMSLTVDNRFTSKYFYGEAPDLRAIAVEILQAPEIAAKMREAGDGATMDDFLAVFAKLYPAVYHLYVQASANKTDTGLRRSLGRTLQLIDIHGIDIFKLHRRSGRRLTRKYFIGVAPDLKDLIYRVLAFPDIRFKLVQENGGVTMDEILTKIRRIRPDIYQRYVQSTEDNSDQGLRSALGVILGREGIVYRKSSGRLNKRYFWELKKRVNRDAPVPRQKP